MRRGVGLPISGALLDERGRRLRCALLGLTFTQPLFEAGNVARRKAVGAPLRTLLEDARLAHCLKLLANLGDVLRRRSLLYTLEELQSEFGHTLGADIFKVKIVLRPCRQLVQALLKARSLNVADFPRYRLRATLTIFVSGRLRQSADCRDFKEAPKQIFATQIDLPLVGPALRSVGRRDSLLVSDVITRRKFWVGLKELPGFDRISEGRRLRINLIEAGR